MSRRDANPDLLRAFAISLVVAYHVGQWLMEDAPLARAYLQLGAYGVDLFFVLSGWFVGRLYWRELKNFGKVELGRFLTRRWLRTLPPYFLILPLAYGAVLLTRGAPFDWRYLVFLQNYETQMPFFLLSWSLCVEEHFYLALPLLLPVLVRVRGSPAALIAPAIAISTLCRILDPSAGTGLPFGYAETATHLRLEGLLIGVWLAYVNTYNSAKWAALARMARLLLIPAAAGILSIPYWPQQWTYCFGYFYVAFVCALLLVFAIEGTELSLARLRPTRLVASCAYSIYLTHSLVLNAWVGVTDKMGTPRLPMSILWVLTIFGVGYLTYRVIERPAIEFRDRLVPRRIG